MSLTVKHTATGGTESSGMVRPALRSSAARLACVVSFLVLACAGPAGIAGKNCAAALAAAESMARDAKLGIWAETSAIKNAESPGDILSAIGHFSVVEGRVLSIRQAGAITYLNFGRNWTRDFAATISRRIIPAFESAGLGPKSFENRRIRVRGVVSSRGGPRIELLRVGQVEVLGGK